MAIQIDIDSITSKTVAVFLYYIVPAREQVAGAIDPTRQPLGTELTASELTDLRNGSLYEYKATLILRDNIDLYSQLVAFWNRTRLKALEDYREKYDTTSKVYRDGIWS